MRELEKFLNVEAEWVLEKLSTGTEMSDRDYYQGRLDQLTQVKATTSKGGEYGTRYRNYGGVDSGALV